MSTDKNENSNFNNASTYDATGEVCAVQDFYRMEVEGSPGSIFEAVAGQAYLHLNIEVSQERCCDMVMNEIMDNFAKYFDPQGNQK